MQKRISPAVKAIADAHIAARKTGNFDNPPVRTQADVLAALFAGKTFTAVLEQVELRYCSIGSLLISRHLDHESKSYKAGVYKGFKALLQK